MHNHNLLALNFDSSCLTDNHISVLNDNNFDTFGGVTRGYVQPELFSSFLQSFGDTSVMNDCLLDMDYELVFQVDSSSLQDTLCVIEDTVNIFYNGTVAQPAAWDLDLLDNSANNSYSYQNVLNPNVDLWILDTGVNDQHVEFLPSQVVNVDPTFTRVNLSHPHGTGTSCCAGGLNYGSSKRLTIYNYPVCRSGGSCGSSDVDNGLKAALNYSRLNNGTRRIVINLSLGSNAGSNPINGSYGKYLDGLFSELKSNGAIIVVAAGNSNQDACNWYYSFSPNVISVGSLDKNFAKSSFSNWGDCVDIYTFGGSIVTAYSISNNYQVQYVSGTSFSSPFMAGLVANLLLQNFSLSQNDIVNNLRQNINNLPVAVYGCLNSTNSCCRSSIPYTRLDEYCKSLSVNNCVVSGRPCRLNKCDQNLGYVNIDECFNL